MVTNVHERVLKGSVEEVGRLVDNLASAQDELWPKQYWPPMQFDRPLSVGAVGRHGPIRYFVEAYLPGRSITFRFNEMEGLEGAHKFEIEEIAPGTVKLRHIMELQLEGKARLSWPLAIRWLHDALLEDLLDQAEAHFTGRAPQAPRWSFWVRLLRRTMRRKRVEAVAVPKNTLIAEVFDRIDYGDAYRVRLPQDKGQDVAEVGRALSGVRLKWVGSLMWLRNQLVKPFGLETVSGKIQPEYNNPTFEPGTRAGIFKVYRREGNEILMGDDDKHLNYRVSLLIQSEGQERWAVMSTVVHFNNWLGRLYFVPVRLFHRLIVPAIIKQLVR